MTPSLLPPRNPTAERVVFDASVLLSNALPTVFASLELGFCQGYWSSWIVSEIVRKRTEWIAQRAADEGTPLTELDERLRASRARVNRLIDRLSGVLSSVDYRDALPAELDWLRDPDDVPVMQTALADHADALVTLNSRDFPIGQRRNGVLLLDFNAFSHRLSTQFPESPAAIRTYLEKSP